MLKRVLLIASLLLLASSLVQAQDGGQFCVRAFEDRNSNGTRDSNEPLLTRGIVAELNNAQGVVIASATLEESQTAAAGVICFPNLAAGDYMLTIISADYSATTPNTRTATITPGELPIVLEYGGALRAAAASPTSASSTSLTDALGLNNPDGRTLAQRLVVSTLGTLAMVALMTILGVFVWMAILRPRAMNKARRATSTGTYRAVTRDDMLSMYGPPADDDANLPR